MYEEEVRPMQDALRAYPAVIKELQDDIDILFSEGQASPTVAVNKAIDLLDEPVSSPPPKNPNRKPINNPLPILGHGLLSGLSGGGKTNALMAYTIACMEAGHEVHLIDTKGELGQIFERHVKVHTVNEISKVINALTLAAQDRMQIFGNEGRKRREPIRDLWEYQEVTQIAMPVITLIIEELILVTEVIDAKQLQELYVAGRSSGIFVFAATQRLKADILPTQCSGNITTRVYLGSPDKIAMRTLFPAAIPSTISAQAQQHLGPPGNALVYLSQSHEYKLMRMPRIDKDILRELMQ